MSPELIFCITMAALFLIVAYLDVRYGMLKDISTADKKPYSWSRVQLTWWSIIILSAFIAILFSKGIAPTLQSSTLILLGISSATTASARVIDRSEQNNANRSQNQNSEGLILDVLSDEKGVSIHRFQGLLFNIVFGIWFICTIFYYLKNFPGNVDNIIPGITQNNLILMGLSNATYVALKSNENK